MDDNILHFESWQEAVAFTIKLSGKSIKEVAFALWPSNKRADALLREALSPTRKQKLSLDEIIFICQYCGRYDALYYMAQECNHLQPKVKTPADETQELKDSIQKMQKTLDEAYKQFSYLVNKTERSEKAKATGLVVMPCGEKKNKAQ